MKKIEDLVPKDAVTELTFFVNGKKVIEPRPDPSWTLLWYLRTKLRLTGTKSGCGEGGCGACTVMLSWYLATEDRVKHIAVNACLTPVCAVYGKAITTVEGIGSTQEKLHPVQERIAKAHGSQCGFCTPGIVMSMYALLRNKNKVDYDDIETALQGNLCRCTGYRPIIDGFKTFTEGWERQYAVDGQNGCSMGENCCKNQSKEAKEQLFDNSSLQPYDRTQEPIYPPELRINYKSYDEAFLFYKGPEVTWLRPTKLNDLLLIKKEYHQSKIVVGNTEIGVEIKFKNMVYPLLLSPNIIPDLNFCKVTETGYVIGGATSLTDASDFLAAEVIQNPAKGKIANAIVEMLHWFAGNQVRNVASLAGNIMTASPISDLNPIFMASSAVINVHSFDRGLRRLVVDENFFVGYRQTAVNPDEILISIEVPFSKDNQLFKAYKQARRRDDDISIVTGAFLATLEENGHKIEDIKMCYGGMGPTTVNIAQTTKKLKGKSWNQELLKLVFDSLTEELLLHESVPGGMAQYRKSLCLSLFFKFFTYVEESSKENFVHTNINSVAVIEPKASQYFEIKNAQRKPTDAVGMPIPHASAFKQATGEAVYCDDIPQVQGELFLTLVLSEKAYAKIKSVDASKALAMTGVIAFFSANDLDKDCNKLGPIFKDEEIFSSEEVTSRACVIGAIVAVNETVARKAKQLVTVSYEEQKPAIITLEDAIAHKSYFHGYPRTINRGDVSKAMKECDHVINGTARTGAQEHFYLEPGAAFAIRKEDEIEIYSSTQAPGEVAELISHALRIPHHKVVCKVKRIGGGFGGKETRASLLAVPVAIAAYKLKAAVRAVLDRDEDMQVTGYRHPVLANYKIGFDKQGKIIAAIFDVYANTGNSMDISCSMIDRAIYHVDNCYFIPNIEVSGYLCKTHLPSNTAFRGFGGPQAMFAAENMIRDVAVTLGKSYEEVIEINLYKENQLTHYNQTLTHCTLTRCWTECITTSGYWQRKEAIESFNRQNRWKKKGIAIVPTKYGISFGSDFLMQAGALLLVYTDGSVLLSIGGIEMGQGLFTKMIQVASRALEIDISKIHISEMSSDKVPNSSPTAASISSDLYGMAVLDACKTLMDRLKPYKTKNPNGKWEDWISAAYMDRVNLSVSGFYRAPKIQYDKETNSGDLYEYFTYGVACSEVLVDCLTGDHEVLRSDIVMDLGDSLNPAIDIGQIEGAFMQGYGLFTIEELVFSPSGALLSRGPGAYKIPAISDIPKEFNVSLLKGAPNPRAVYSSKAVGEPPLFLASSVFFAIKEAIASARRDAGAATRFQLDAPATCEKIRMACDDEITRQVNPTIRKDGKQPWNVIV
ncbi:xanthine dehydrogenase [Plutella xylostella]|uniref:xanthine dehydrogenase n=1 Tax=Plutella xylostella TaxID=51655 RepID=UPI002032A6FC|nr:xanthine dehydrogenase [Plutella xylostella]